MAANRYVYDFDEPSEGGRELLGGKGVCLAEMTQLGVPVPAGFTITTDACRVYVRNGKRLPDGLEHEIDVHIAALEEKTGQRFGDPRDPLLVSVRSGAAARLAVVVGGGAALEQAQAVAQGGQGAERVGQAGREPADHPGADAAGGDA